MQADRILKKWSMIMISVFCLSWTSTAVASSGHRQGPPPGDFIESFDGDGDGMVSQEEFPGPENHFAHLDQNNDGFITVDEKPQGPPPNPVKEFDQDGDGRLTLNEFPGPDDHFEHMDRNGDGYIDEDEAPKEPPSRSNGPERRDRE